MRQRYSSTLLASRHARQLDDMWKRRIRVTVRRLFDGESRQCPTSLSARQTPLRRFSHGLQRYRPLPRRAGRRSPPHSSPRAGRQAQLTPTRVARRTTSTPERRPRYHMHTFFTGENRVSSLRRREELRRVLRRHYPMDFANLERCERVQFVYEYDFYYLWALYSTIAVWIPEFGSLTISLSCAIW